jgi:hypothetical protein
MPRDDFALQVKTLLAQRVGVRCSNPNCRQQTSGPQIDSDTAVEAIFRAAGTSEINKHGSH